MSHIHENYCINFVMNHVITPFLNTIESICTSQNAQVLLHGLLPNVDVNVPITAKIPIW